MNAWSHMMDFGVIHPLIYLECRGGEGPIMETLPTIVNDSDFGAIEIAPIKNPEVRQKAKALLAQSQLQVVYLPILPILLEKLEPGSEDADKREATTERLVKDLQELCDYAVAHSDKRMLYLTFENFDRDIEKKRLIGP